MTESKRVLALFDVDGTLTVARKEIKADMIEELKKLRSKIKIGIVGGSDMSKQYEQLGKSVLEDFDYVFTENGLVAFKNGDLIAKQSFSKHLGEEKLKQVINFCLRYMADIEDIPVKRGTFIEFRAGMINVSPIGRNCSQEERDAFEQHDLKTGIRKRFVSALKERFPDLDLVYSIGGQISFDMFPKGWDKTYCLRFVKPEFDEIHFFGDKTFEGGNDFEIYTSPDTIGHCVNGPDDTIKQIRESFGIYGLQCNQSAGRRVADHSCCLAMTLFRQAQQSLKALRALEHSIASFKLTTSESVPGFFLRSFAALPETVSDDDKDALANVRNIGISAHIDSGKTTLTERVLFYTGRIHAIHDVRGKDGVGAKMDSMDLEREKGITIQSAATFCRWKDTHINIIDTPGHVDFTIEVERALRVLDGAVLVLCSVSGVQSQSITVDRQMRRYDVPRVAFINKLDRAGADPWKVIRQLREKLRMNAAAVQYPIGLEEVHKGVVDLVSGKVIIFEGEHGENLVESTTVPADIAADVESKRKELVERLAEVDDEVGELFLMEEDVPAEVLKHAVRRATVGLKFVPVFMGSAFKNKGVQLLLNGVADYLPTPLDVTNTALLLDKNEERITLPCSRSGPLVALAFKLEEGRFGQLTYTRIYSGVLTKGDQITNMKTGKRIKVPRLVRMHADELEDITEAGAGDIVALFGVECASGDTFTDGNAKLAMSSMTVPEPVMSLAVAPKARDQSANFSKALNRFQKEDPTFRVALDPESGETIISGMGELHLEIYIERMKREYKVDCEVGKPRVNYRETITRKVEFDYLHKKQSGGQGQYGRVVGYLEPLPADHPTKFEFENGIVGNAIPPNYIPAIEKGFKEAVNSGALIGHPVEGVKVVLTDGAAHAVDSSELAFKLASMYAFRTGYETASPTVLEPVMAVEVSVPSEFQGAVIGDVNRRKGIVMGSEAEGDDVVINAHVPLNEMFGYSTALRSMTQGKGEFTMEYQEHNAVTAEVLATLTAHYKTARAVGQAAK